MTTSVIIDIVGMLGVLLIAIALGTWSWPYAAIWIGAVMIMLWLAAAGRAARSPE